MCLCVVRLPPAAGHLPECGGPAAGAHGLAQPAQEQGRLLRQAGEGAAAGGDAGPPQLDVLRGHSPKPARFYIPHCKSNVTSYCSDQFCGIVEEVYNPIFSCYYNMIKFPHCVSDG